MTNHVADRMTDLLSKGAPIDETLARDAIAELNRLEGLVIAGSGRGPQPDTVSPPANLGEMVGGEVKWFNPDKGYGFITPDDGSDDVFVHVTVVRAAGLQHLLEGVHVMYEPETDNRGRLKAARLALDA